MNPDFGFINKIGFEAPQRRVRSSNGGKMNYSGILVGETVFHIREKAKLYSIFRSCNRLRVGLMNRPTYLTRVES
jgi:hypothetical protein